MRKKQKSRREQQSITHNDFENAVKLVQDSMGLDHKTATKFHIEMWVFVHGIATMLVTSYLDIKDDIISEMISDVYQGLREVYSIPDGRGRKEI